MNWSIETAAEEALSASTPVTATLLSWYEKYSSVTPTETFCSRGDQP